MQGKLQGGKASHSSGRRCSSNSAILCMRPGNGFRRNRRALLASEAYNGSHMSNTPALIRCAILICASYTNSKSRANRLPLLRIDNRGDDSCRFDRIVSNRNIFNPPSKPSSATNSKSRANRLPLLWIDNKGDDSCRFDRIDTNRTFHRRIDSSWVYWTTLKDYQIRWLSHAAVLNIKSGQI